MATRPSSVVPMFVRAEYQANQTFQRFESDAQSSANRVKQEFQAVGQVIDQALSAERTSAGALDLGVDELRQAAAAQQQRAVAAREVADAALRAAQADGVFNAELREGVTAARQYATQQEEVANALRRQVTVQEAVQAELNQTESAVDAVTAAQRRGTNARGNVINSVRAERTAFVQLGQQLQDVTVQAQLGTNAFQIFSQQAPQAAFALTGLANSANSTKARVGELATFLSGPWGAAVFAATAVLGPYIAGLFDSSEAAGDAAKSVEELVEEKRRQEIQTQRTEAAEAAFGTTLEGVTAAIRENRDALQDLNAVKQTAAEIALESAQRTFAEAVALQFNTQQQLFNAQALLEAQRARASGPGQASEIAALGLEGRQNDLESAIERFGAGAQALNEAQAAITAAQAGISVERGLEGAEGAINRRYNALIDRARDAAAASGDVGAALEAEVAALDAARDAEIEALNQSNRSGEAAARRRQRELDRLREFAADAGREIAEIDNRFVQIPPSVALVNRSVQELDDLIAELEQRRPPNFEPLVEQARAVAEDLRENGLDQLINSDLSQLQAQMAQQLQTQRLILGGRQDEAEALAIINRLQEQHGDLSEETAMRVREMVAAYADAQLELDNLQERQAAFLDATRDLRQELESLFAGEGVDFERVFNRLRARLQVQEIFGDALQGLEDSIYRDFEGAVGVLSRQTIRGADALDTFSDNVVSISRSLEERTRFIERPNIDPTNRPRIANPDGSFSTIETLSFGTELGEVLIPTIIDGVRVSADEAIEEFQRTGRHLGIFSTPAEADAFARRLSQSQGEANSLTTAANDNRIIVDGYREVTRGTVSGTRLDDFVDQSSRAVVDPMLAGLPPEIANQLRPVLTGALGGFFRAGPVGAGIGLLQGLDISDAFNAELTSALEGAQAGALANNLLSSIGIGGSNTGATIGGAAGALSGIPGGSIIGSVAGSLLGSVLGGSKRGSATIGGFGDDLSVTGIRGNSSREAAANDLAGSVIEAIERIAEQLGTTINASAGAVSIGTRGDTFRVDPRGTGRTRQSNGAISFDDAQSAVAFAVEDLIGDGLIVLQAQEQRLFRGAATIEQGIDDVLRFRSILDRTGTTGSPLEQEIIALNREYEEFINLFDRANASVAQRIQLEESYEQERAELVANATDRVAGSLQDLINDLTIGDNGLSLRARRENALGEFNSLAARVSAGDTSAFDDFEDSARALLDIERELFGSQRQFFERQQQVLELSRGAVSEQQAILEEAANTGSPFGPAGNGIDLTPIGVPIAEQTSELRNGFGAANDNLGTLIAQNERIIQALSNSGRTFTAGGRRGSVLPSNFDFF